MPEAARLSGVLAAGVCTSLGYTVEASFAAQRAGLVAFVSGPDRGADGELVKTSPVAALKPLRDTAIRLEALALDALGDMRLQPRGGGFARLGLFVGLPHEAHFPAADARGLLQALSDGIAADTGSAPDLIRSNGVGRGAFFFALHDALEALDAGECDGAIVGAVDSLCAPVGVLRLDRAKRLLGAVSSDGLIPGEGAAFVLIAAAQLADPLHCRAHVLCASIGREARHFGHEEPNTARAMSAALRKVLTSPSVGRRRADLLYTCETGERYWTDELSLAYFRNVALMPEPFVRMTAAEAFGDLGAAAGAVQFVMGLRALARPKLNGRPNDLLLVCGSSDDGHLGVCMVQRAGGAAR